MTSPGAPVLPPAIQVRGLRRSYDAKPAPVVALDGVDLDVAPGEFFGLLGPNGAGKTTLIKILTTLLLPSSGRAEVFGFDVERDTKQIRRIMNMVAGGEQSGYGILSVREQLWMFSQFYGLGVREGWRRVDELLEAVGLAGQREQRVSTLSTGQRQKMNMARGLLNDPWILFLDEPTLGLDVGAARAVRQLIVDWREAVPGRTVLLTTHYMAEADELCDRLAIVDRGRILAIGSPADLKRRVRHQAIVRLALDRLDAGPGSVAALPGVVSVTSTTVGDQPGRETPQAVELSLVLVDETALGTVVSGLTGLGSRILTLHSAEPTLEDVFVELVGRGFAEREAEGEGDEVPPHRPDQGGRDGPGGGLEPPARLGEPAGIPEARTDEPVESGPR